MKKLLIVIVALLVIVLYRPLVADPSTDPVAETPSTPASKAKLEAAITPVKAPSVISSDLNTTGVKPLILESHLVSLYLPDTKVGTRYSLSYAKNNRYPGPSLKNASVHIMLYKYANPDGFRRVKTDAFQHFSLDEPLNPSLAVEVLSIDGQEKLKLQCFGGSLPGKLEAIIKCQRAR